MFAYIVRRLLWAVALLFVLSIVTFSIFYLVLFILGMLMPLLSMTESLRKGA